MPKNKMLAQLLPWVWVAILGLGLCVRFWRIEYLPSPTDADELAYIWAGQSLLGFGTPISWSSFAHKDTQWHWQAMSSTVVSQQETPVAQFIRPWFDHNFVLPLLMGSWSKVLGYGFPSVPPALLYRLPFLVIAGVNLALIFAISRRVFGYWAGLFSLVLASFSPTLMFAQRMVVSENLMSTFILLTIYLFIARRPLWALILATGMAGLVKLPGLSIAPVIVVALLSEKKYQAAAIYASGVAGFTGAGYLIYGMSIDLPAFLAAMKDQSSRLLGWANPAFILSQPGFHTKAVLDMSYYLFLLFGSLIFFIPSRRETKVLAGAALATWLTIWGTSAEQDMLGWYKIPLFCVLAVCSGSVIEFVRKQMSNEKESMASVILAGLLFMTVANNLALVRYPTQPLPETQVLRIVVGSILLLVLGGIFFKVPKKIITSAIGLALVMYAAQAVWISDQYFAAACKDRTCITPTVTFSQSIKSLLKRGK